MRNEVNSSWNFDIIRVYSSDSFIELRRKAVEEARRVVIGEKVIHQLNKK